MAACLTQSAKASFAAIVAISALLCPAGRVAADVVSVGAVTPDPLPPGPSNTQLIVGAGTNSSTTGDLWGYVSVDDGTLLQYGTMIVGNNEGFFGQVDVSGNFLAGQDTKLYFSGLGGGTPNPTVQIGNRGTGYLNVSAGSTMVLTNSGGDMTIGLNPHGVGYATVKDQFTIMTVPDFLTIGQEGIGTLNVLNGALVRTINTGSSRFIGIGTEPTGVGIVTVDGLGSILRSANSLVVSGNSTGTPTAYGQGTLRIGNGAFVDVDNTTLARVTVGPWGRIELDGGTLVANTPTLTPIVPVVINDVSDNYGTAVSGYLGGTGLVRGSVYLGGGASTEANAGDVLRFDSIVSNQGSISVNAGEMQFLSKFTNNVALPGPPPVTALPASPSGRISLENGGTIRFPQTLTTVNDGVLSNARGATYIHGAITNNGEIVVARDATATFYDTVNNAGTITVKPGGNALFLADLMFIGLGSLQLGVSTTDLGDNSAQISAGGVVTLGGTLEITFDGGFVPTAGQSFELISAGGGIVGAFDSMLLPLLPQDLEVGVLYNPTSVMMEIKIAGTSIDGVPGDYNNDGIVDAADYTVWRDNLGSPNSLPNDDTPGVDQNDYTRWKTHFGEVAIVGSGAGSGLPASTPEPSGMALFLVASLAATVHRRRRRIVG